MAADNSSKKIRKCTSKKFDILIISKKVNVSKFYDHYTFNLYKFIIGSQNFKLYVHKPQF